MTALPKLAPSGMTIEEFLDWSGDSSGKKFELVDGEPRAIAPAGIPHGIMHGTLARLLGTHLSGTRCYGRGRAGHHSAGEVGRKHSRPRSRRELRSPQWGPTGADGADPRHRNIVAEQQIRDARECLGLHDNPHRPGDLVDPLDTHRRRTDWTRRGWDLAPKPPAGRCQTRVLVLGCIDFSCLAAIYENTHLARAAGGG